MQRLEFRAMGSSIAAIVDGESPEATNRLAQVPLWFAEWEDRLTRFREDSELAHLNRSSGTAVQVSPVLWEVIRAALAAAADSDGMVQPTLLDTLVAWGYGRSFEAGPSPLMPGREEMRVASWREIVISRAEHSVRVPAGVHLDLGGVAKGWAADRAARRLRAVGPAVVDAGGDVAVTGARLNGEPWPIGVADPRHPGEQIALLKILSGGVATSGRDYRRWQQDGARLHHLIDPRTRRPAQTDVLAVTVIGPSTVEAESAAKTAFILGSEGGRAWLERRPRLAGLLVLEDGRALRSSRFPEYEWR